MKGTRVVRATVIGVTVAQFTVTYVPPLQRIVTTEAVPILDGFIITGVGAAFFAIIEVEKQLRLSFRGSRTSERIVAQ